MTINTPSTKTPLIYQVNSHNIKIRAIKILKYL
jgi:hypothetical protein